MDETQRVMLIEPDCCATKSESHRCRTCGLTGTDLWELRQMLPATQGYLMNVYGISWTGYGAIFQ